jgi:rhamnose transport system permease protein
MKRPPPYRGSRGWNLGLGALIIIVGAWAAIASPLFLHFGSIMDSLGAVAVSGILALGLAPVVITGEIDISLTSNLGFCTVVIGMLAAAHVASVLIFVVALLTGLALGAANGALVAGLRLPSLAVTLGTMGAYEGLGFIIGGNADFSNFPGAVTYLGSASLGQLPVAVIVLAVLAAVIAITLRLTGFGRLLYGTGRSAQALRYSGIRVGWVKLAAFALAGGYAAAAALVFVGYYGSGGADSAAGTILTVVTMVALGGIDIYGGSGGALGVTLAVVLIGVLEDGMGLVNVSTTVQTIAIGCILIATIGLPLLLRRIPLPSLRRPPGPHGTAGTCTTQRADLRAQ